MDQNLEQKLSKLGKKVSVHEVQTVPLDEGNSKLRNLNQVSQFCKTLKEKVSHQAKDSIVVTLGGDHSLSIGSVSGVSEVHKNLRLIWVDAHADINTEATSLSGSIHGCSVAFLLGLQNFDWKTKCLEPSHVVYIGLRDVELGERRILKEMGIRVFTMHDVDKWGIDSVCQQALDHLDPFKLYPIHLSFDIDSLDPDVAPATGTLVQGGLTVHFFINFKFREGRYICEKVHQTKRLVSMDLVEVNPLLAPGTKTAQIAVELICSAMGHSLIE